MDEGYILHADGDSFFAACEVARRPDLRGKPVVVGEERGIASSMTIEAKHLGIRRGMPIFEIRKTFPSVVVLSSHFELYQKYHENFVRIVEKYLPGVESYSIDECFARIPELPERSLRSLAEEIKKEVNTSLGTTFSFGIARTKTLAKIASKLKKPDGCVVLVQKDDITRALDATDIRAVWGIGYKTSERLEARGIRTASDFINVLPFDEVQKYFAEPIAETWKELYGIRIYNVGARSESQKSIQATRSFIKATNDPDILFSELSRNIEIACRELRALGLYTRTLHIFYAHKIGVGRHTHRRSARMELTVHTQDTETVLREALKLSKIVYIRGYFYKSTGVTLSGLKSEKSIQNDLFGGQCIEYRKSDQWRPIDALNRKFGDFTVMYGSSLASVVIRGEDAAIRNAKDNYEYGLPLPYMGEVC